MSFFKKMKEKDIQIFIYDREGKEMEFHAYWDYRVALDLFLGGLGIGIFLLAAFFSFVYKERSLQITRIGFFLAPALVGLGVFALLTELGKPFRMFLTFINVNPTSVTSWGGFLQTIFILLGFAAFYFVFRYKAEAFEKPVFKMIVILGSIFALAVGVYHGLLLMSIGRPAWASGLIPVMFLVSSLLAGTSVIMVIEAYVTKSLKKKFDKSFSEVAASAEHSGFQYSTLIVTLVVIQTILVVMWRISINTSGIEAIYAYQNLISHYGIYWWLMVVGLGLFLPLVMATYFYTIKRKMNFTAAIVFSAVVLLGSYAFKHIILYAGQIPLAGL